MEDNNGIKVNNPQQLDFKAMREKVGVTFEDMANLLEITESYYKKIESGYVGLSAPIARKLSEFYQMDIVPFIVKNEEDKIPIKIDKNDAASSLPSKKMDLVLESPNKKLNKALKIKHQKLANTLVWYYQKVAEIKTIIDEVYLKGGDL